MSCQLNWRLRSVTQIALNSWGGRMCGWWWWWWCRVTRNNREEERRLACLRSLQELLSPSLQLKIKIKSQSPSHDLFLLTYLPCGVNWVVDAIKSIDRPAQGHTNEGTTLTKRVIAWHVIYGSRSAGGFQHIRLYVGNIYVYSFHPFPAKPRGLLRSQWGLFKICDIQFDS